MSDLISNLPENITKGITLNNQHIDLFEIIDDASKSDDEKKNEIIEYLKTTKKIGKKKSNSKRASEYIDYIAEKLILSDDDKKKLIDAIFKNFNAIFKKERMIRILEENGFENSEIINDTFLEASDVIISNAKEGIADFLVFDNDNNLDENASYQKVLAFYSHVLSNKNGENRYNRINFDSIASPGEFMSFQEGQFRPKKLQKAIDFIEKHNLSGKINAAFFYMHSSYPSNPYLRTKEDLQNYYNDYFEGVASIIEDSNIESYDIFNEFVYRNQPQLVKEGEVQYAERHNGFHAILSLDEICDIAKNAREKMPNVEFLYNDDGWEIQEKREGIFREIEKIKNYEDYDGQLLNAIGMQFHTDINIDISQIAKAVKECKKRFPNLNVNITELDIGEIINGFDYNNASQEELEAAKRVATFRKKQIMKSFVNLAKEGKISELTIWSQSDEMGFRGKEKKSSVNNFDGKSYFGKEIEATKQELENYNNDLQIICRNIAINLAKEFKTLNVKAYKKVLEGYLPEVQEYFKEHESEILEVLSANTREPEQNFNFHTHTMRCGHAADFTEDYEYVEEGLKVGIKSIAFTDHIPFPKSEGIDPKGRMQIEETDDYLDSIKYLQKEYSNLIEIQSGFEFEYSPDYLEHLRNFKSKTDIMILGQHFVKDENGKKVYVEHGLNDENLELYAQNIEDAIELGLPNIIAHPDIFMAGRKEWGEKEIAIAERICDAANSKNIPLEINMGNIIKIRDKIKKGKTELTQDELTREVASNLVYPCKEFWEIVKQKRCKVIYGRDAHCPTQLSKDRDYEIIKLALGKELLQELDFADSTEISKKVETKEVLASSKNNRLAADDNEEPSF